MRGFSLSLAAALLALLPGAAGATWPTTSNTPLFVCNCGGFQTEPAVDVDASGGIYVAWTDSRDGQKIRLQRFDMNGNVSLGWPFDGLRASNATTAQRSPAVLSDGAGGVYVGYEQRSASGDWNVYAQHFTSAAVNVVGWPASGVALCTAAHDQTRVRLVTDGSGGFIATWNDHRSNVFDFLYGVRVNSIAARGSGWPLNGRMLGQLAGPTTPSTTLTDGFGGAFLYYLSTDSLMRVHRIQGNGEFSPSWPINDGVVIGQQVGQVASPVMVGDGSGGVYLGWSQYVSDMDLKAARVKSNGAAAAGWSNEGYFMSSTFFDQNLRSGVSDGQGGVILLWDDTRNSSVKKTDIYGLRLLPNSGVANGWISNGTGLDVSTSDDRDATAVTDGLGGAIVVYRSGNFTTGSLNLVAQRVTVDGVRPVEWSASGKDIGVVSGRDAVPSVVPDGYGGAIVVWSFENTATPLARMTRIDRNGQLQGPPTTVTTAVAPLESGLALSPPAPNPTSHGTAARFSIASRGRVALSVIDPSGRRVRRLRDEVLEPGTYREVWRGDDERGNAAPSGLYFVVLEFDGRRLHRRVVLTR